MRQRTLAGFHLTKQLRHLASDILNTFFVFSPFPGFFLRDGLSKAVFVDPSPIFFPFPPFPALLPAVPVQRSLDCQEDQRGTSQQHRGRQGCRGQSCQEGTSSAAMDLLSLAGRRVSHRVTPRQGHMAHNPNKGWGQLASLVHSGALLRAQLSQMKMSADLSRMIKPSHAP